MKRILKWIPRTGIPLILFVLMACLLVYAINLRINASSMGAGIGQNAGSLVGRAIGSAEGMTRGRKEGSSAGQAEGLSAVDTEVELANELHEISNLEVLVASVKIKDTHSIGKDIDYMALYLLKGEVIFSVDLSKAQTSVLNNQIHIVLPEPSGQLIIDQSQIEKIAEYQKHYFSGDAESGFDAFLNSMAKVQEATAETLNNYDVLIDSARESAINQVTLLAKTVSKTEKDIYIEFEE